MHLKIWVKFIGIYLLFAFVSVFALAAFVPEMSENAVMKDESEKLYREATLIASDYMSRYYTKDSNLDKNSLREDLSTTCIYQEASIWLMDFKGQVLLSVGDRYTQAPPEKVESFNQKDFSKTGYLKGKFYGAFDMEVLSVSAPVNAGLKTTGYVLMHKETSRLSSLKDKMTFITIGAFIIVFCLSLSILGAYMLMVHRPLQIIVKAATEYGAGNLTYEIPVESNDEMGYLAASLNLMASQLNQIEETQKKFIANVSHDFRSPLTSIKGYSEAIADGTIPWEMAGRYLDIIVFETERLTDLTTDLLTLSDLDSKGKALDYSEFDFNEIIKKTASSFQGRCVEKKLEIDLLLADYKSVVKGDRGKIQQVFYNLLDNAIKFSEPESTVTVETTNQGNKLLVSIKDEGIGIPKESLEKIWDRFYKTDFSRGKDKKGTGLGLAIVKEIIQAHGENISVISTKGVGSEFIFTLTKSQS